MMRLPGGIFALMMMLAAGVVRADPIDDVRTSLRSEIGDATAPGGLIVVDVTPAGHWELANRDNERFTAATAAELRRGFTLLGRAAANDGTVGHIYVTPRAALQRWKELREVPATSMFVADRGNFRLMLRGAERPLVDAFGRPTDVEDMATLHAFGRHLGRALGAVRIVALEPGGPRSLSRVQSRDPETRDPLVDAVDPAALVDVLSSVAGQLIVITGRVDGDVLRVRGSRGGDAVIDLKALRAAARDADVSLVLRHGTGPAQPHTPRFRLLRRDPSGPPQVFNAFVQSAIHPATAHVRLRPDGGIDATLEPQPTSLLDPARWTRAAGDLVKPIFGETPVEKLSLWLPAPARQEELDRRLIRWLPSWLHIAYPGLLVLGFMGWPTARRWFGRLWPPERGDDYDGRIGWHAARVVRALVFALVFLPLAGIFAAPLQLLRLVRRTA